jgi:hypothetical protein
MRNNPLFVLTGILLFLFVSFGLSVLFYLTLHRCLSQVKRSNRVMDPALVWLNLIPLWMLVWTFVTVSRVGGSLRKEFEDRGWKKEGEHFGVTMGTAYGTLLAMSHIPCLGLLFIIPTCVTMVWYWMQIAGYSGRLTAEPPPKRRRSLQDDDLLEAFDFVPVPPPPSSQPTGTVDERIRR